MADNKPTVFENTFYDVEHGGDIDEIKRKIWKYGGGRIVHEEHNYEAEILHISYEVADPEAFRKARQLDEENGEY